MDSGDGLVIGVRLKIRSIKMVDLDLVLESDILRCSAPRAFAILEARASLLPEYEYDITVIFMG